MLPASDVKFLQSVVHRLSEQRLHVYAPGGHRAAVALILRFGDAEQKALSSYLRVLLTKQAHHDTHNHNYRYDNFNFHHQETNYNFNHERSEKEEKESMFTARGGGVSPRQGLFSSFGAVSCGGVSPQAAVQALTGAVDLSPPSSSSFSSSSSLRLLYMKRKEVSRDRWSGQVSFPGGLRDPDDADDLHTVYRTVNEVLGIPLSSREFWCLGQLPDYPVHSRVVNAEGLVQARFVFLHVGDLTPSVKIADHEVESVRWVPLTRLQPQHVVPQSVVHPLSGFVQAKDADRKLILSELFPGAMVAFPSVSASSTPAAATEHHHQEQQQQQQRYLPPWRLWGLSLRTTSELLMLDDRPTLDWPLFSSNSALLQHAGIDAFHGYYEAQFAVYRAAAWIRFSLFQQGKHPVVEVSAATPSDAAENANEGVSASSSSPPPHPPLSEMQQQCNRLHQRYLDYHHGGTLQRRRALLPPGAPSLLYAVPDHATPSHLAFFCLDIAAVLAFVYMFAALVYAVFAVFRVVLGLEGPGTGTAHAVEERRKRYSEEQLPLSLAREQRLELEREKAAREKEQRRDPEVLTLREGYTESAYWTEKAKNGVSLLASLLAAMGAHTTAQRIDHFGSRLHNSMDRRNRLDDGVEGEQSGDGEPLPRPMEAATTATHKAAEVEVAEFETEGFGGPDTSLQAPVSPAASTRAALESADSPTERDGRENRTLPSPSTAQRAAKEPVFEYNQTESVDEVLRRYKQ